MRGQRPRPLDEGATVSATRILPKSGKSGNVVARGGLEPPSTDPESAVLPLDDRAIECEIYTGHRPAQVPGSALVGPNRPQAHLYQGSDPGPIPGIGPIPASAAGGALPGSPDRRSVTFQSAGSRMKGSVWRPPRPPWLLACSSMHHDPLAIGQPGPVDDQVAAVTVAQQPGQFPGPEFLVLEAAPTDRSARPFRR